MTICKVLDILPIEDNTAIVAEGDRQLFKNGIGILDENGKPFLVLSVGMDTVFDTTNVPNRVSLLLEGKFSSHKLFV